MNQSGIATIQIPCNTNSRHLSTSRLELCLSDFSYLAQLSSFWSTVVRPQQTGRYGDSLEGIFGTGFQVGRFPDSIMVETVQVQSLWHC